MKELSELIDNWLHEPDVDVTGETIRTFLVESGYLIIEQNTLLYIALKAAMYDVPDVES